MYKYMYVYICICIHIYVTWASRAGLSGVCVLPTFFYIVVFVVRRRVAGIPKASPSFPKASQSFPKPPQSLPKHLQSIPKASQSLPKASQSLPKHPQSLPESPRDQKREKKLLLRPITGPRKRTLRRQPTRKSCGSESELQGNRIGCHQKVAN